MNAGYEKTSFYYWDKVKKSLNYTGAYGILFWLLSVYTLKGLK